MKRRKTTDNYILDEQGRVVPEPDLTKWAAWFEDASRSGKRIVKQEWVANVHISTVFLGLDYNFLTGSPILWETMCFTNRKDLSYEMRRCGGNREQAEAMHNEVVKYVQTEIAKPK